MRRLFALLGFVTVIAGTYCPLLRPFYLFDWNIYTLNKPYGIVVLVLAVAGIVAFKPRLTKAIAYTLLLLVMLLYVGALFKVHTTFSFIPFKGISAKLAHLIKFRWGWLVLFAGSIMAAAASAKTPKTVIYKKA